MRNWKVFLAVAGLTLAVSAPLAAIAATSQTPAGQVSVALTGPQIDAIASKAAKKCETNGQWIYQDIKDDLPKPTPSVSPPSCPKPTKTPSPSPSVTLSPSPSASVTPSPSPSPTVSGSLPASVLNLTNWKLTLPVDKNGNASTSCSPREVLQPELNTFSDQWFHVNAAGDGVVFRNNIEGCTTSNSNYARSELREETNNGTAEASWSSTSGTATMELTETVNALPPNKPQDVVAQVHGSSDDVVEILADGTGMPTGTYKLAYRWLGSQQSDLLIPSEPYGARFTLKILVASGVFNMSANGGSVHSKSKSLSDLYFKAGNYTQSNVSKGHDAPGAYGEDEIYSLAVTHS